MLYDESTASSLRPWLVRTLQPICDADPEALADYVIALLKHDAAEPELRKMFVSQLEEFLEKEASKFVDSLFSALRTKSYLPYEPVQSEQPDAGIPIPLDLMSAAGSSDRGRKRSLEGDEHEHPPPKGPRLSNEGPFSRYPPSNGRMPQSRGAVINRGGQLNGRGLGRSDGSPMNGHMHSHMGNLDGHHPPPMYRPPGSGFAGRGRRGICRDYHNNGFCARGSLCQYSHGEDAVIPPIPYANGPPMASHLQGGAVPFIPMFGNSAPFGGMPGAAYDPHESHMEMGSRHGRVSIVHRPVETAPESYGMHDPIPMPSRELPVIQDLTPRDPVEEATHGETVIQPNGFTHNFGMPRRAQPMGMAPRGAGPVGVVGEIGGRTGGGGGFRPPGRGMFTGENHSFRSGPRDDKTLVVEKIPEDKLTLEAVNEWFKRFGVVTNVAIDSPSAKALVSFSTHTEAHTAWKSEEAVFGNRFVKLFWHRPLEGHGGIGQRALAASAALVKNMATPQSPSHPQPQVPPPPLSQALQPPPPLPQHLTSPTPVKHLQKPDPATVAALAARQQLLEKQISEQKVLMSRLTTASTAEEKQEIMARIRSIQSDMKPSTPISPQPSTSKLSIAPTKAVLSEKERLDKELEMHTVQSALSGSTETVDEATSTAALKEKLARLKAEASRLGVPESEINAGSSFSTSSPYRPYRGRGFRARGFARGGPGRAGAPRASMKLDNRPRKLLIQGALSDEVVQAIRNHYQNMGNLESFWNQGDGEVVAQFWSRTAAEHALANGPELPSVGKVKINWHTGMTPASTPTTTPSLSSARPEHTEGQTKVDEMKMDVEPTQGERDDGGWGQAYDDEEEERRRRSRSRSFS